MRLESIKFYIHFTIAGSHARCPTISRNGFPVQKEVMKKSQ